MLCLVNGTEHHLGPTGGGRRTREVIHVSPTNGLARRSRPLCRMKTNATFLRLSRTGKAQSGRWRDTWEICCAENGKVSGIVRNRQPPSDAPCPKAAALNRGQMSPKEDLKLTQD
ncbi:hypothetical protein HPP92_025503 [Vanilla planifolia]|uniref:Uncharacterized protein n=1 Tax=Vanilla planifolia TaxID=51239 RepID=A0A835PI78_VANPL|nr:hypothetical protein HPP92_025812 [Vanilla planifolia]KAG0454199.1 hypothetical protein HPP92_025503 [Vanilla planifolia]